ncbi:MAG: helix-turn-helix transcriptional regulator [Clostridia bacterium]|nr:helix-turn-helix transcriptional regulator [Clostridia bacterium]
MEKYGAKIRQLRIKSGMTQAELGEKLNVTSQAVSKWENDLSQPDLDSIKKICDLFGVTANEFLGTADVTDNEVGESEEKVVTKVIAGYCSMCQKPVEPGAYTMQTDDVGRQYIYCDDCQAKRKEDAVKNTANAFDANTNKGYIWGGIIGIIALIASLVHVITSNQYTSIPVCVVGAYCIFTFITQMIWGNSVFDCFLFFCRSFRGPGLIFELSLDGIIWLITVKLVLAILLGLLSIIIFLIGVVVSLAYSGIALPFAIISRNRQKAEEIETTASRF